MPAYEAIEGIDTSQGLRTCAGNQTLYTTLLGKFLRSLNDLPELLSQALAQDRLDAAAAAVHSIKGVAANLGASKCKSLSAALELTLHDVLARSRPIGDIVKPKMALLEHVADLQTQLESALSKVAPPDAGDGDPATAQNLQHVCKQLVDLLNADSPMAEQLLLAHSAELQQGLGSSYALLRRQIQDFDFVLALETLAQALPTD